MLSELLIIVQGGTVSELARDGCFGTFMSEDTARLLVTSYRATKPEKSCAMA